MSLDDALAELLAQASRCQADRTVTTFDGRRPGAGAGLVAALQVPPQDNSSMDGYACAAPTWPLGAVLPVSQRIARGQRRHALEPGTAARIFTGAPVPAGADAVLMQEERGRRGRWPCGAHHGRAGAGQWIRRAGEDVTRGAVVLPGARACRPPAWAWRPALACASWTWRAPARGAVFHRR
jgi:molybdopterin molybdotransferase